MTRPIRKTSLVVLLVLAATLTPKWVMPQEPADSQPVQDVLAAFEKSKTAKSADDFSAMVELLEKSLAGELPAERQEYAKRLLGWALNRRGEAQIAAADKALAEKNDEEAQRLDAAATADFAAALKADPNHWKALHNRGTNFAREGKLAEALADFNRALELQTRYANTWFNRGEIHYAQKQFDKAINDYNQAASLSPEDAMTLISRGDAFQSLAQWDRARDDYRRAVALDASLGRAQASLAWLLATCPVERLRDSGSALLAAGRAVELDGETHHVLDVLAAAQASSGRYEDAQRTIARAIAAAPEAEREPLKERQTLYAARRPFRQGT